MKYDHMGLLPENAFNPDPLGRITLEGGGGSKSPKNTTSTTTQELPKEAKPYLKPFMEASNELSERPYTPYEGQRIAGLTPEHFAGLDMTTNRALMGSPVMNAAQAHSADVFNDTYMNRGMDLASQQNPMFGQVNPFMGDNPYLQGMIDRASDDVTKHYNKTVNPQLAAMDRASGAFGNSGVQEARADSQEALARQLGDISTQMRYGNYSDSAKLAESGLARDATLAQQTQNNMMNMFGNERNNQMALTEFAPALASADYDDAQNLLGVGDIYRDNAQQNLNFLYDQWQQEQNYPYQQVDVLGNAIRTAMGAGGSTITSAPNAYSANTTANMIGTGLAGYGALQGLLS